MAINQEDFLRLETKARELRHLIIDTVVWAGSGHVGGSLSAIDIMTVLYHKYLNIDPADPTWEDRDRFILSKGHIGVGLAPVLADKGYFPTEWLKTYNHTGSNLGMHLDKNKVPGLDASAGSLGHGLPLSLGLGLSARYKNQDFKTYCLMGDGECDEGSVWEAAMALEPFTDKWLSFGFNVIVIDGHNLYEISEAIDQAHSTLDKPSVIIANTFKGCGVEFMKDNYMFHYASFDAEKQAECHRDINSYHDHRLKQAQGGM